MPESPFTGLTASVKIGSGETSEVIAYVSGVDLTLEKDIIEIIAFGMEFREKVPAIKDWSASISGTVALSDGGTQKQLYDAFSGNDPIKLGIYLDEDTYFEGSAFVQNFNISATPEDAITLDSELAGSGAVVLTLPTGA